MRAQLRMLEDEDCEDKESSGRMCMKQMFYNNSAALNFALSTLLYSAAYAKRGAVPPLPNLASCHLQVTALCDLPGSIAEIF